jgi:hypothetical protein
MPRSALLYAVAEAVTWNHASQPDSPRKGQRVIIFPKDLFQLEEFLATGDPNIDSEDGHPIAYEATLRESQKYETTPLFLKEDCERVVNDPHLAANVPEWLAKSRQVATGNRRRVLEDGADVENSSDEDDPKMKPDELSGMYTAEMDPKAGPRVLPQSQVAYQRAVGRACKEQLSLASPAPEPERKPTPLTSPANSDDEEMSEDQRRHLKTAKKMADRGAKKPAPKADPEVKAPATGPPLKIMKSAAPQRAPADQPTGAKAPPPKKGQESPETKVSVPMVTRQQEKQASGAGGLRPGGGSGQKDTRVTKGHPSKT